MSYDHQSGALSRLEQFDHSRAPGPRPMDGAPGGEMFGAIFFPGVAAMKRHPVTGILLMLIGVVVPILLVGFAYINRADIIAFALNPRVLVVVTAVGLGIIVSRLIAIFEISRAYRYTPGVSGRAVLSMLAVLVLGAPVLFGVYKSAEALAAVSNVFAGGSSQPIYEGGTDPGIRNVLLLGGDSGPGRWGMRTDTMIIASINKSSGRMALISIPRNLARLRFPPGTAMGDKFPDGFNEYEGLTNAVFTYLAQNPQVEQSYNRNGLLPQAVALSEGIGYSLGVTIDDYALVNMAGFAQIIDALGGVTIYDIPTAIPLPPVAGAEVPPTVGPGTVHMNGPVAIAYVRSRELDSDYARMGRQRELLAALGSQVSPASAAGGFGQLTGALDDSMRTSLTAAEFSELLTRMGDQASIGESVGLNPPLIKTGSPDYDKIKTVMDGVENFVRTGEPSGYAI